MNSKWQLFFFYTWLTCWNASIHFQGKNKSTCQLAKSCLKRTLFSCRVTIPWNPPPDQRLNPQLNTLRVFWGARHTRQITLQVIFFRIFRKDLWIFVAFICFIKGPWWWRLYTIYAFTLGLISCVDMIKAVLTVLLKKMLMQANKTNTISMEDL